MPCHWRRQRRMPAPRCGPIGPAEPPPGGDAMTKTATRPAPLPGILDIAPYVGGDAKLEGVERPIRLASNESALGPSPKAVAAYRALAGDIHRSPDGSADALRRELGERYHLDPARIVCGA